MTPYPATPADAPLMAAIHATGFSPGDAWTADVFRSQIVAAGVIGLLHPAGGLILARVAADEAEILTLAVLPPARGVGVGRALVQSAAEAAAERGALVFFLEVSVRNAAARRLYGSAGFAEAGRRRRYYSDQSDALVMRLELAPDVIRVHGGAKAG